MILHASKDIICITWFFFFFFKWSPSPHSRLGVQIPWEPLSFLSGACMSSLCPRGLSAGTPASFHSPKSSMCWRGELSALNCLPEWMSVNAWLLCMLVVRRRQLVQFVRRRAQPKAAVGRLGYWACCSEVIITQYYNKYVHEPQTLKNTLFVIIQLLAQWNFHGQMEGQSEPVQLQSCCHSWLT